MKATIEIDTTHIPEGWEPVAYRVPEQGDPFMSGMEVLVCNGGIVAPHLILERKRWRAEKGGEYWVVSARGGGHVHIDSGRRIDNLRFDFGNYFQTEEQAEKAAEAIKATLTEFHK